MQHEPVGKCVDESRTLKLHRCVTLEPPTQLSAPTLNSQKCHCMAQCSEAMLRINYTISTFTRKLLPSQTNGSSIENPHLSSFLRN